MSRPGFRDRTKPFPSRRQPDHVVEAMRSPNEVTLRRRPEALVCSLDLARRALALLREREWWTEIHGAVGFCDECSGVEGFPHREGCKLAATLRELEEVAGG